MQIAAASCAFCTFFAAGQSWQKQGRDNRNDGNDDQQLNQSKAFLFRLPAPLF
jgi:hypothetical protein